MKSVIPFVALAAFSLLCIAQTAPAPIRLMPRYHPRAIPGRPLPVTYPGAGIPAEIPVKSEHVYAIAFSPDGKLFAWAGGDLLIHILTAGAWTEIKTLQGSTDLIYDIAFSSDSTELVAGGADRTVRVWNIAAGHEIAQCHGSRSEIHSVRFLPDGKRVVSGEEGRRISLWDVSTEQFLRSIDVPTEICKFSLSLDAKRIAVTGNDGFAYVFNLGTGDPIASFRPGAQPVLFSVAFSPDGKRLLTAGGTGETELWDIDTQSRIAAYPKLDRTCIDVLYTDSDSQLIVGDTKITFADAATQSVVMQASGTSRIFGIAALSPDHRWLVAAPGPLYDARAGLMAWDLGNPIKAIHGKRVDAIAASSDGTLLATAGAEGLIKLWTAKPLAVIHTFTAAGEQRAVAFTPDHQHLIVGGDNGNARIFPLAGGATITVNCGNPIAAIACPTNSLVALAIGNHINFIDFSNPATPALTDLSADSAKVTSLSASPDGIHLASGSADTTAALWDIPSKTKLIEFRRPKPGPVSTVAFSPDGKSILVVDDAYGGVLFDVSSGLPVFQDHDLSENALFSPNGQWIVHTADSAALVTFAEDGRNLQRCGTPLWRISTATFLDNQTVACGTRDGLLLLFPLDIPRDDFPHLPGNGYVDSVTPDGAFGLGGRNPEGNLKSGVRLWNLRTKTVVAEADTFQHSAISPDHQKIVTMQKQALLVTDLATDKTQTLPVDLKNSQLDSMAFSPDGRTLVVATNPRFPKDLENNPPLIQLWDLMRNKPILDLVGQTSTVAGFAFSPDGKILVTRAGSYGMMIVNNVPVEEECGVRIWNLADGACLKTIPSGSSVMSALFTPDGKMLVTVTWDGLIATYDTGQFQERSRNRFPAFGNVGAAAISHDGRFLLVTYMQPTAKIISLKPLKIVGTIDITMKDGANGLPLFLPDNTPAVWTSTDSMRLHTGVLPR